MLERPDGPAVSHLHRLACHGRPDTIGNNPVVAKSPPPITLPALAVDTAVPEPSKKEFR